MSEHTALPTTGRHGLITTLQFVFSGRRRHTRCGRDWSSDVCSSDLKRSVSSRQSRLADTRRRGIFLVVARAVWIAAAVLTVIFVVVSIPVSFAQLQTVCTSGACLLTPESLRQVAGMGLSTGFFAAYLIAVELVFVVFSFAVGVIIFWRMWGKP